MDVLPLLFIQPLYTIYEAYANENVVQSSDRALHVPRVFSAYASRLQLGDSVR
jgi:hypothetical protein